MQKKLLDLALLSSKELDWLDAYHETVSCWSARSVPASQFRVCVQENIYYTTDLRFVLIPQSRQLTSRVPCDRCGQSLVHWWRTRRRSRG